MPNPSIDQMRKVFSDAAILTFAKMTSVDLVVKNAGAPDDEAYDVSALIRFTGDIEGACTLRLAGETAKAAISRFAGEAIESSSEITDGVGELVNMIAGNAKAALQEYSIELSFPEVTMGKGGEIGFSRRPSVIAVYYGSEIGDVAIFVDCSVRKNVSQ